jgi:class 3 adenylate cyclase
MRPLDRIVVIALMSTWAVFAARSLVEGLRNGQARVGVSVHSAPSPDAYPTIRAQPMQPSTTGLEPGTEILSVAGDDLGGRSALYFYESATRAATREGAASLRVRRSEGISEVQITLVPTRGWWLNLGLSAAVVLMSLFFFLRSPHWHFVRTYFLATWCLSVPVALVPYMVPPRSVFDGVLVWALNPLGMALTVLVAQDFTLSARPVPSAYRALAVITFLLAFALLALLSFVPPQGISELVLGSVSQGFFLVSCVAGLARAYSRSEALERRQIRWVVLGGSIAACAQMVTVVGFLTGSYDLIIVHGVIVSVAIPAGVLTSVLGYGWLDVDRLISATASYTLVGLAIVGAAVAMIPKLAQAAAPAIGLDPEAGEWVLTMGLVGVGIPVHRFLRPRIDQLFFKERYAVEHGIGALLWEVVHCVDARELTRRVGEALVRLLRPEGCVVYAAVGERFEPIFVEGRAVPPVFAAASPLVSTLRERRQPLCLSDAGRRPDAASLGPFDRAALQTLEAEVLLPVHREGLAAFVCLGPKRSGDVYTATDISLLAAVVEGVSHQLRCFDQEEVIRQSREMQEALRRYVPGAVAEELAGGRDLESTEREVTVLFVDMRGYTSFAERRSPREIFSTLDAYTEKVSRILGEHGGSIVEFNGDGLLAVFGAPRPLERKERAAVEAAREIFDELTGELAVGIGIATGIGFVGNIRGSDRMIWSVVGNPTNLAARLQTQTRDLDAAIAIDAVTRERAGYVCADFAAHHALRIRGRSEPQDVWALPLQRSAAKKG